MMTDPISDMLSRIRNAALARHERTEIPASKFKESIAKILKSEGYIADVRTEGDKPQERKLTIVLRYGRDRGSAIDGIRRVSRPGRRVYVRHDHIPNVLSGLGISIVSTSRGLMTDRDARKHKLGGEVVCEVW